MDAGITKAIEELRTSLDKHYDLPKEERRQADAMFARIEQFGSKCRNRADFEEKFATQTISREFYSMLFNFTAYVKPI